MNRIGLALSGGGFRATLYHLGLIRFLRDANLLSQVTHVTSVSGGSIFAAHLVLNWDRYNGSPGEFDAAASEIVSIVRLDIRNRILRRWLPTTTLHWPLRLLRVPTSKLSRTGLLQSHYERYLYGDTSLFELPEKPQLHILATNLSEGCLCSFTRDGLLMVRRAPGNTFRIDRVAIGLATVPMAVTASSAFPGFFPPLELTGADVGASVGEFGRQAYTDGGVFDNLGIRMFRCLERSILADHPLCADDFFDLPAVLKALRDASQSSEDTPLRRLSQVLVNVARSNEGTPLRRLAQELDLMDVKGGAEANGLTTIETSSSVSPRASTDGAGDPQKQLLSILWEIMSHYQFYHEPLFARLKLAHPDAEALHHEVHSEGRVPDTPDIIWLNRHLLDAAFRETTGRGCFRRLNSGLDAVIVSDVGKPIAVTGGGHAGGIIRTALRASDILMDRVWQLEKDTFQNTPGFVFVPITRVIEPNEDPTAMHPQIQSQLPHIRTDVDRFSLLEISALVRHGYCVARKACEEHRDLFSGDLPHNAPWDPVAMPHAAVKSIPAAVAVGGHCLGPAAAAVEARFLQASAVRKIWSSLFDYRDWTSYVYLPLLVAVLILLPQRAFRYYQSNKQTRLLIEWLYQGNRDMAQIKELLETPAQVWPSRSGAIAETRDNFDGLTNKGFKIVKETRIADLRLWNPDDPSQSIAQYFRSAKILKESGENDSFFVRLMAVSADTRVRFPIQQLRTTLLKTPDTPGPRPGTKICSWGVLYDFSHVPEGHIESVSSITQSPGLNVRSDVTGHSSVEFDILADTAQLSMWVLMPEGKAYDSWHITRTLMAKHGKVEVVTPIQEFLSGDSTIIGFQLASAKTGEKYEIGWTYK